LLGEELAQIEQRLVDRRPDPAFEVTAYLAHETDKQWPADDHYSDLDHYHHHIGDHGPGHAITTKITTRATRMYAR